MNTATGALDSALSSLLSLKFPQLGVNQKNLAHSPRKETPVKPVELTQEQDRPRTRTLVLSEFDSFLNRFNQQLNDSDNDPSSLYCGRAWSNTITQRPYVNILTDEAKRSIKEAAKTAFNASATLAKTSGHHNPLELPPSERVEELKARIRTLETELANAKQELEALE
eukprot:TRINITY_DN7582_c0_g1_i3.p1 TRINITY_DN7582_c0_g1~~TRINITY_DN7582_c0_g1_i3.p1  ORF type:complete len:168 (+),score=39.30 TRINITY_DN7582_c0_g1_i3:150-653(+)